MFEHSSAKHFFYLFVILEYYFNQDRYNTIYQTLSIENLSFMVPNRNNLIKIGFPFEECLFRISVKGPFIYVYV